MFRSRLNTLLLLLLISTHVIIQSFSLVCSDEVVSGFSGSAHQLVEEILSVLGFSDLSFDLRYSYYYGGRPLLICGGELKKLGILGLDSSDLVVGVFVNNSWRELPYRVFIDKIEASNGYTQYVISPIITESSCLELILPSEIPEVGNLTHEILPQVRGSKAVEVLVVITDEVAKYAIPLYFFINPTIKDRERSVRYDYDYGLLTMDLLSPYRTHEKLRIVELVNEEKSYLQEKLHLTDTDFNKFTSYLIKELQKPINSEVKSIEILEPRPPEEIPDGGGGPPLTWNYVERTPVLFNNLVWVGGEEVPQTVVTLTASNASYSSNYYLVSAYHSWQPYNPHVIRFSIKLRIYGNDTNSRTLRVTIDNEQKTYTIYPHLINEVLVNKYYYDYPGRDPSQPISYNIKIEPAISPGKEWRIEGEVITYYNLNTTALNSRIYNGTYDVDLFSAMNSWWYVILRPHTLENYNYRYSVTSLLPTPYGGYVDDGTNMGDVNQDYVNVSLRIEAYLGQTDIDWSANYTLRICLGGLLCGNTNLLLTKWDNLRDITIKIKPVMNLAPRLPLYRWLATYLYDGNIPLTIELKPNTLENVYPHPLYIKITPLTNYSNYRTRFYYKNIVSATLANPNILHYTTLYTCAPPSHECSDLKYLSDKYSPYAYLLAGIMRVDIFDAAWSEKYNIYTSSSAYISISRMSVTGIRREDAVAHLYIGLGLPSIVSAAVNQDLSVQARYNKFRLELYSSNISMGSTTLFASFYDPGPGANLPEYREVASRVALVLGVLTLIPGPSQAALGAIATFAELFALVYDIYRTSLTNEVQIIYRANHRIIVEYDTGSATSTSAPLSVRLNDLSIGNVPAVLHVKATIRLWSNPEVYPARIMEIVVTKSVDIDM
ncbi:MAG: hypothetical protein QXK60_06645 [Zestosphaera sp.]